MIFWGGAVCIWTVKLHYFLYPLFFFFYIALFYGFFLFVCGLVSFSQSRFLRKNDALVAARKVFIQQFGRTWRSGFQCTFAVFFNKKVGYLWHYCFATKFLCDTHQSFFWTSNFGVGNVKDRFYTKTRLLWLVCATTAAFFAFMVDMAATQTNKFLIMSLKIFNFARFF